MSNRAEVPVSKGLAYRPDIDGLRALAVIPVVLFHAGISGMEGGFVGVDVFFVISGYLITGILYREAKAGKFSILKFYERRIRRIMPNLLVMLLVATLACSIILIPIDLYFFGQSLISTILFSSNIYLYLKMGYFAPTSQQIPLLHMWSLGVEEQYYLVFPFILVVLVQSKQRIFFGLMWLIFFLSFAAAVYYVNVATDVAFYLPFARLWELMTGSLLAIGAIPAFRSHAWKEAEAFCGVAAILGAIFFYDQYTPFPGVAALAPCLGSAALIHANGQGLTATGRVMAWRPFVAIGLLSYSLYIWHWPVIVLTRYAVQRSLHPAEIAAMLTLIGILSAAAWQWVEKPMRAKSVSVRRLLTICGSGALLVIVMATTLIATHGLPQRYGAETGKLAMAATDTNPARSLCDHPSLSRLKSGDVCHVGPAGSPLFAMIGDSFGDAMEPAVVKAAADGGVPGIVMTFSGCAPLPDVDERAGRCRAAVNAAYALVAHQPSIHSLFLIGRWPAMVSGRRDGLFRQDRIWLLDASSRTSGPAENASVVSRGLARAVAAVAPAQLVVVTGIPEQHVDVPQAAAMARLFGRSLDGIARSALIARQSDTLHAIATAGRLAGHPLATLDLTDAMCGASTCPVIANGVALYVDDNHPSRSFALRLAQNFAPILLQGRTIAGQGR